MGGSASARRETLFRRRPAAKRRRATPQTAPLGGAFRGGGARTFIDKGTNVGWRDTLTPEDIARYEARAVAELGTDCARWLATGEGAETG